MARLWWGTVLAAGVRWCALTAGVGSPVSRCGGRQGLRVGQLWGILGAQRADATGEDAVLQAVAAAIAAAEAVPAEAEPEAEDGAGASRGWDTVYRRAAALTLRQPKLAGAMVLDDAGSGQGRSGRALGRSLFGGADDEVWADNPPTAAGSGLSRDLFGGVGGGAGGGGALSRRRATLFAESNEDEDAADDGGGILRSLFG